MGGLWDKPSTTESLVPLTPKLASKGKANGGQATEGKDNKGKDNKGNDNKGKDNKGNDNKGEDNKGKDNKGKDNKGKDNKGNDNKGKDNKGKDNKGKGNKGKDNKGKDNTGKDNKGNDNKGKDNKGKDNKDNKGNDNKGKDNKGNDNKGEDNKGNGNKGKDSKGNDNKGKDNKGKDNKGKDNKGKDNKGKDNKGKDNKGKDNKGKDNKGNDNKGKDNKGNDNKGKDNKGKGNNGKGNNGKGNKGKGNKGKNKTSHVQIVDCLHWDQLVAILGMEEDNEGEENFENYTFIVWYQRHFSRHFNDVLFPPAVSDLGAAREGHVLHVSHQHAAQAYMEEYLVWVRVRGRTITSLLEVIRYLAKASKDVDIANLSGSVTCLAGGILSLIGILLAGASFGASLALTATGTALAIAGAVTSTGAAIADAAISFSKTKQVTAILGNDLQASRSFSAVLDRLSLTSRCLNDWTEQHPGSASQVPRDTIRAMCGMFGTIRIVRKFSVAVSEKLSAVKATGRVIHATDECVTFTSHSAGGAMAGGGGLVGERRRVAGGRPPGGSHGGQIGPSDGHGGCGHFRGCRDTQWGGAGG